MRKEGKKERNGSVTGIRLGCIKVLFACERVCVILRVEFDCRVCEPVTVQGKRNGFEMEAALLHSDYLDRY